MQREQAYPAGHMNGVLMGVASFFGDLIRNVMDDNDAVEDNQGNKDQ
ncbi:hypothetical protein VFA_002720 [Vibrio furnissii CIP 102972]|nr:hypothetical protein VFA_002720 [Vibrio furnissii CIP 102972]